MHFSAEKRNLKLGKGKGAMQRSSPMEKKEEKERVSPGDSFPGMYFVKAFTGS